MSYALNLAADGRILSATQPKYAPAAAVVVDSLPEGNISDYLYINGEFIYAPLPEPEPLNPKPADTSVWDDLDAAYQAGYHEGYTEGVNSAYDQ